MHNRRDQIWDTEISKWKHRNYQREIFLVEALKLKGKILEIGPGYGRVMIALQKNAEIEIIGLELSENLADKLRLKGLNVVNGDALNIPFDDISFDAIICEEVIEHIYDQELFVKEIYRILKLGGIMVTPI